MEKKLKIGDRVTVTYHGSLTSIKINGKGKIVAIDKDGDYLVKMDLENRFFNKTCLFNNYFSDRKDLVNIEPSLGHTIELI